MSIALHEARHALDDQAHGLDRLRDHTLALLIVGGAATIAADHPITYVALLVLLGGFVIVVWPREFTFVSDGAVLVGWAETDADETDMRRDLALWMSRHHDGNGAKIRKLRRVYEGCLVIFAVQVVTLIATRWPL